MTIPAATKANLLNGQPFTDVSLHTDYPGTTGVNEATGGTPAYARQAITVAAASGGTRLLSGTAAFDVPAGTYKWFGFWNSSAFVDAVPNGGATPKNFMALPSDDKVYCVSHGYADADTITFYHGVPPAPLVEGTTYFVRDATTDTFKVAATSGGSAINLTAAASFGCVVSGITEQVHSAQGTHTLTAFSYVVPD